MSKIRSTILALAFVGFVAAPTGAAEPDSDPRAVAIAESVLEKMGGRGAWDATRVVRWDFMGRRRHWWDLQSGQSRIEADKRLVLLNVRTKTGRAFQDGQELAGQELADALVLAHKWWINDSYWLVMPYKLLDPGVTLGYVGERPMQDGRPADVLQMTFGADIGYTPQNRYEVSVAKDTGLLEEWAFFADAKDTEPKFVLPWHGWKKFGRILLATDHGTDTGGDWNIAVFEGLAVSVFESPDPVGP